MTMLPIPASEGRFLWYEPSRTNMVLGRCESGNVVNSRERMAVFAAVP